MTLALFRVGVDEKLSQPEKVVGLLHQLTFSSEQAVSYIAHSYCLTNTVSLMLNCSETNNIIIGHCRFPFTWLKSRANDS